MRRMRISVLQNRHLLRGVAICFVFMISLVKADAFQAATVDQVLAQNEDAVGGKDAIALVNALRIKGTVALEGSQIRIPLTITVQRPNLTRTDTEVSGKSVANGFDGSVAWSMNLASGTTEVIDLDKASNSSLSAFQLDVLIGSVRGICAKQTVVLGPSTGASDAGPIHLRSSKTDGSSTDYFIDRGSSLLVESSAVFTNGTTQQVVESFPSAYKKVNGINIFSALEVQVDKKVVFQMNVDSVEVNPNLDPSTFRAPPSTGPNKGAQVPPQPSPAK